jgi:predicted N-acetyltransferase YhbS
METPDTSRALARPAGQPDHQRVRDVLAAAYQEYAAVLPKALFERYLADVLDLDSRARTGQLLVAEHAGRVVGTVTYYADAGLEGFGWPSGWAGLRALGVDPAVRGLGIGRALMLACLNRAVAQGASVLCLHTAEFMTTAVAIYEAMGFRRVPAFDFDGPSHLNLGVERPVTVIAYRLDLPAPA